VAAPDLPGHGRSAGAPLASVEACADWIVALLDALGAARAFLIGHSMGALVALETALRYPARVERLALLGAALPMPVADMLLAAARDNEPKAIALVNAWSYSAAGQIGGNTVPGLWLLGMNRRLMERQKPGVFHADLSACNAYQRALESLAAIACPTCVIAGNADRMTPLKASRSLAAAIPGASLAVIPGSGHALMAERPDAVLDALRDFAGQR
jgi:pimeloyl-ACP methyl ester carboxylesterase